MPCATVRLLQCCIGSVDQGYGLGCGHSRQQPLRLRRPEGREEPWHLISMGGAIRSDLDSYLGPTEMAFAAGSIWKLSGVVGVCVFDCRDDPCALLSLLAVVIVIVIAIV